MTLVWPLSFLCVVLWEVRLVSAQCLPDGTPLTPPNGTQAYCGLGGADCPTGYVCDIEPADGHAVCCRTVLLTNGQTSTYGIVKVFDSAAAVYKPVCGFQFDDISAGIVCRELGFSEGKALPYGAFGRLDREVSMFPVRNCTGTEASIVNCRAPESSTIVEECQKNRDEAYAAVSCYNNITAPVSTLEISNGGSNGPLSVYRYNTWGQICSQYWGDHDADVACRQLGYMGGVATYHDRLPGVPYLITVIGCLGSETSLEDCEVKEDICWRKKSAGVICYNSQAPQVYLDGGDEDSGNVVISIDGVTGTICNTRWIGNGPEIVCRNLGFATGSAITDIFNTNTTDVFMSGVYCELLTFESIFQCDSDGWRNVSNANCSNHDKDLSVRCYQHVRLQYGIETDDVITGRVEMYFDFNWFPVCSLAMAPEVARVMCGELGYPVPVILAAGSYGSPGRYVYVSNLTCSGSETSVRDCKRAEGWCPSHAHAALLCTKNNIQPNEVDFIENGYYGRVIRQRYGVNGTICRKGWDDVDANVLCKENGYKSGVYLGTPRIYDRRAPIWVSDVSCDGTETTLGTCGSVSEISEDCYDDDYAAGVLCATTDDGISVRLGNVNSNNIGIVEIFDGQEWGTICDDTFWTKEDAAVVCKEEGYAHGQDYLSATGGGDVFLSGLSCSGTETSILQCPNHGWKSVTSICGDSKAQVKCFNFVTISYDTYGSVNFWHGNSYGLVCSDGFDQKDADVVCKETFYRYATPLCCSAFGPMDFAFTMSNVRCQGSEKALQDCPSEVDNPTCPSGTYASVLCSPIQQGYTGMSISSGHYGLVKVTYNYNEGYICTEGFDDNDAAVVCKQAGYQYGGFAYKDLNIQRHHIRWLRGLGCSGDETNIQDCGSMDFGQVGVCDWRVAAAVICYKEPVQSGFQVRLTGATATRGRVELNINGTWGSICGTSLAKAEATAICTHMGYRGGAVLDPGSYGALLGPIWLQGLDCVGNETDLRQCLWGGFNAGPSTTCGHSEDAAIMCESNIRLSGSSVINYGRLEFYNESDGQWKATCDHNFYNDKAEAVCRRLGYKTGKAQCCSPLGDTSIPIAVTSVVCSGQECTFTESECTGGKYVALYCSETDFKHEYGGVRLPLSSSYGPVEMNRFGLWGGVCDVSFNDNAAGVVCRELGYSDGHALSTFAEKDFPIVQGRMTCTGNEVKFGDCNRRDFLFDHGCSTRNTVAGVFCYGTDGVTYGSVSDYKETAQVNVVANGDTFFVGAKNLSGNYDTVTEVFCRQIGYVGGKTNFMETMTSSFDDLRCMGDEASIFQCPGNWDPRKQSVGNTLGVDCYKAVEIVHGDGKRHGILYASKGTQFGPVCHEGFDTLDADVACRDLGYDHGLSLCCTPYGFSTQLPIMTDVACTGQESFFTDCPHREINDRKPEVRCQYVSVACYSGSLTQDYSVSLAATNAYTGEVILTYMGIHGRICTDGWDDEDASVVCKEMGFQRGIAYLHFRDVNDLPRQGTPYWTSEVSCDGRESRLGNCGKVTFGQVSDCRSGHHAGILCYDNEGIFYRLGGGDDRSGRVEVSIHGEWNSICNTFWGQREVDVLCRTLDYRTGDVFTGDYTSSLSGPVWEPRFYCNGTESDMNQCPFTGWSISTSTDCSRHANDAGAFCYMSVKLSTGVGRTTDKGAVLFYDDGKWFKVCGGDNFNDTSAKVVCHELGFADGQAQCCENAYGELDEYGLLTGKIVECKGGEQDVRECLVDRTCTTSQYASVVCYRFPLSTTEAATPPTAAPKKGFDAVPIIIGIVVAIVIIAIAVVVLYCVVKSRRKDPDFHPELITTTRDGSVAITNELHGFNTPELNRVRVTPSGATYNNYSNMPPTTAYTNASYSSLDQEKLPANKTVINVKRPEDDDPYLRPESHYDKIPFNRSDTKLNGSVTDDLKTEDDPYLQPRRKTNDPDYIHPSSSEPKIGGDRKSDHVYTDLPESSKEKPIDSVDGALADNDTNDFIASLADQGELSSPHTSVKDPVSTYLPPN